MAEEARASGAIPDGVLTQQTAQQNLVANSQSIIRGAIDDGGATAKGQAFNRIGAENENITRGTLAQIDGVVVDSGRGLGPSGPGRDLDFIATAGSNQAIIESKYTISVASRAARTRITNQLTNAVNRASANGDGSFVVLQVARAPTPAELTALRTAVGDTVFNQVRIVSTQTELYQVVQAGLRPPR